MKYARLSMIVAALALCACERSPQAVGTVNSIIVLAPDSVWAAIGDSVLAALEPRIFTVRDERTFEVTQVTPADPRWSELRRFRQVLAIGAEQDAWVEPALSRRPTELAPGVVQARDVWARNQTVTALVLPQQAAADAALPQVPVLAQMIDSTFRAYATQRMYMSGPNTELQDSLRRTHGYAILLPNVYAPLSREANVDLYQSSTQVGGDLVRSVLVTWQQGLLPLEPEVVRAWRDSLAMTQYRPALPSSQEGRIQAQLMEVAGAPALELQGAWDGADPTWPMSGPFIARAIHCAAQDRTYLVDAWLYSPSRAKYEYMIQLQTILNTFECA